VSGNHDHDVVVVGGGPAGCAAGVFCAREGLDTAIYDRGRSSLKRCAVLENYPGFPDGIDIETMYDLLQDHAETAGCAIVPELVESLEREGGGFRVTPQIGDPVTARRVVAATRYDGEYMRGLDDDAAMFDGDSFDRGYADHDGTTPVDGLYVASPSEGSQQAIVAAGRGARVAKRVIADARIDDGWWPDVAEGVDWVRREAELDDEWADRERWVEWFDDYYGADAPVDPDSERYRRVRDAYIAESRESYIDAASISSRASQGRETLATHLDTEAVVEGCVETALLEAIDDAAIADYVDDHQVAEVTGSGE
jgi:hypothetical protein